MTADDHQGHESRRDVADLDSVPPAHISRFADDTWYLSAAARKPTRRTLVEFASVPPAFRDPLKRIVWCMLNRPADMDLLDRPQGLMRPRLNPEGIKTLFTNGLRPFVRELDRRGITRLCDVDDGVLRDYSETVATLPISRKLKQQRLRAVTRMWLHALHLPAAYQIGRPPWEEAPLADYHRAVTRMWLDAADYHKQLRLRAVMLPAADQIGRAPPADYLNDQRLLACVYDASQALCRPGQGPRTGPWSVRLWQRLNKIIARRADVGSGEQEGRSP